MNRNLVLQNVWLQFLSLRKPCQLPWNISKFNITLESKLFHSLEYLSAYMYFTTPILLITIYPGMYRLLNLQTFEKASDLRLRRKYNRLKDAGYLKNAGTPATVFASWMHSLSSSARANVSDNEKTRNQMWWTKLPTILHHKAAFNPLNVEQHYWYPSVWSKERVDSLLKDYLFSWKMSMKFPSKLCLLID